MDLNLPFSGFSSGRIDHVLGPRFRPPKAAAPGKTWRQRENAVNRRIFKGIFPGDLGGIPPKSIYRGAFPNSFWVNAAESFYRRFYSGLKIKLWN